MSLPPNRSRTGRMPSVMRPSRYGAHLNPAVSVAFAARGDFPWKRVPAYIAAQSLGAILATLVL